MLKNKKAFTLVECMAALLVMGIIGHTVIILMRSVNQLTTRIMTQLSTGRVDRFVDDLNGFMFDFAYVDQSQKQSFGEAKLYSLAKRQYYYLVNRPNGLSLVSSEGGHLPVLNGIHVTKWTYNQQTLKHDVIFKYQRPIFNRLEMGRNKQSDLLCQEIPRTFSLPVVAED
ncbi:prepilin-type N-terminal cleavage/methylation domain-containing protein [Weissella diestrammenae]|uniref:Prepilin-type N-terminal cleavage/methylation domain-containing protein n=1 Tax=Weissella diestrammenae TaxID=1162633 RepID=A0A7G9T501_9LACO|nr:prepilin-type N-terminal cleavage/methylation domain-containing protein [Weissella diestrammenae]MCM0582898.1 prepilin-type N-terminal cleavage/methylation domain-containing protein [Weissella diestrammenae]QNN75176.1 prepilin-type N-terminal cleavage/methylation domain-containing protein [Weissella diestrammenae]